MLLMACFYALKMHFICFLAATAALLLLLLLSSKDAAVL